MFLGMKTWYSPSWGIGKLSSTSRTAIVMFLTISLRFSLLSSITQVTVMGSLLGFTSLSSGPEVWSNHGVPRLEGGSNMNLFRSRRRVKFTKTIIPLNFTWDIRKKPVKSSSMNYCKDNSECFKLTTRTRTFRSETKN